MSLDIVGKVFQNRYRVEQYLASGGMASVFRVWDLHRNVPLAMKVLHADLAEDATILKRFRREAQALKKLVHPNIVPFYGLEQVEDTFFLLERFIDGPNLKDILRQTPGHALSVPETLSYMKAVCAALGYAHANGVVHCDIKPGNIMVDRGGNIYLADFGIARHSDSTSTNMAAAGTAAYMAPEQILEEPVTPATDVYALGVMAFEMVTGRRPFRGDEEGDESNGKTTGERLRDAHLHSQAPDPREYQPDLPSSLGESILKALNKNPLDRFQAAMDFYDSLCKGAGIENSLIHDRVVVRSEHPQDITHATTSVPVAQTMSKSRLKVWIPFSVGIIAILVLLSSRLLPMISGPQQETEIPTAQIIETSSLIPVTHTPTFVPSPTNTSSPTLTPTATEFPIVSQINASDNAEMVFIPEGTFWMGNFAGEDPYFWGAESPRHKVFLDDFWIYRTEVTNGMFTKCVDAKACPKPARDSSDKRADYFTNPEYSNYPVVNVTWEAAQSYCVWAKGELPSEAQWEKAARGEDQRLFPWGNNDPDENKANFCDINCPENNRDVNHDDGYADTAPVGNYPQGASPYGVLDLAGNVYEWVFDRFDAGYYQSSPEKNPPGPASSNTRVARGGSWFHALDAHRTVARAYWQTSRAFTFLGFRCVVEIKETP